MSDQDFRTTPIDPEGAQRLADDGLRMALVDPQDPGQQAQYDAWVESGWRGFHSEALNEEQFEFFRRELGYRRTVGVWDDDAVVGTVASWAGELTIPGERTLPAWAISSVSVATTHARRGIARAMLESELSTASALGLPMAMLTVSESPLYGRYGFAPAALAADLTIDNRRGRWVGPTTSGRLSFLTPERFRELAPELYARVRLQSPGEMELWGGRWDQLAGLSPDQADKRRRTRAVQYHDADGELRGLATYLVTGGEPDFTKHTLEVHYLLADGPDAYAALWRFMLEQPLVGTVTASLRSVDEPVRWMLSDWRAASMTVADHLWLRVLDVAAAFEARQYVAPGSVAFSVTDSFGYAAGDWVLTVSDAGAGALGPGSLFTGTVAKVDAIPDGVPTLALDAAALSALYLGGISAETLAAAGRLRELTPGAAIAADTVLRSPRAPWLSVWF